MTRYTLRMIQAVRRATPIVLVASLLATGAHGLGRVAPAERFAKQIADLSEPPGSFDTDNLVSNERSYLQVIPELISNGVTGGGYIGVGPDQNFSYIARVRPSVAFIVDVRRDNLLLHLLFKALFAQASNRAEFLCLLTGRAPPDSRDRWPAASLDQIVEYVEAARAVPADVARLRGRVNETITRFGVPLSPADLQTIARFHQAFIDAGLRLQFHSDGQPPRYYYPTYRDLLLATDANGRKWNYLASEPDFQFVKTLQARDDVVPVVGNVNGPHALRAIAEAVAARGERVSAFYISNVENYLFRDGSFPRYAENLRRLPRTPHSVIIRSIFGGTSSVSVVQPMNEFVAGIERGQYRSYWDLAGSRVP